MTGKRPQIAAAILVFILSVLVIAPARAGQAYIGKWSGTGTLVGGKDPEPFRCRLTIAKGAQTKINYQGRCTLVNMNLSIAGTIGFDDATRRYQAAMSSNAGFTGYAVGYRRDNAISFDLAEKQVDTRGNTVRIGARIHLISGSITVDYEVEFNDSGDVLTAVVPFSR